MRLLLNEMQRVIINVYADGDYRHLFEDVTTAQELKAAYAEVGDGLFIYLMKELSDQENCDTFEVALERLHASEKDIHDVAVALAEARRNGGDEA